MKVLIGEQECQDSSHIDLAFSYLEFSTLVSDDGYIYFSKLEILKNLPLLFSLSCVLAEELLPEVTHICLLASSGMAIGIGVALVAKRPLIFYRRDAWPKPEADGLGSRFMPLVPSNAKVALIDSHENTRYTSALCIDELSSEGVQVIQLIAPISFDECIDQTWTRNIRYTSLAKYSSLHETLASKFSGIVSSDELKRVVCAPGNRFWLAPPLFRQDAPFYEFDVPGIVERPEWFLGKAAKDLQFDTPMLSLSDLIVSSVAADDEGRWEFFLDPIFVEQWAIATADVINIQEYDYLIGTSHLGTALAMALAYYNKQKFQGSILFHLGRDGFLPAVTSLTGKKVLPIEMIITSGVYAVDIYIRTLALGGMLNKYITVFPPSQVHNWWVRSRLVSIPRLRRHGIEFVSLTANNSERHIQRT